MKTFVTALSLTFLGAVLSQDVFEKPAPADQQMPLETSEAVGADLPRTNLRGLQGTYSCSSCLGRPLTDNCWAFCQRDTPAGSSGGQGTVSVEACENYTETAKGAACREVCRREVEYETRIGTHNCKNYCTAAVPNTFCGNYVTGCTQRLPASAARHC